MNLGIEKDMLNEDVLNKDALNELTKKIISFYNTGKTLVFPGQATAKSFIKYVSFLNPYKAVFHDKFISFDTFVNKVKNISDVNNRVVLSDKVVFLMILLKEKELNYFIPKYAEPNYLELNTEQNNGIFSFNRNIFLNDLIKNFDKIIKVYCNDMDTISDDKLKKDISLIGTNWVEYLKKKNLIDPNLIKADYSKYINEYVFVFPSSFLSTEISYVLKYGYEVIENDIEELPLHVYKNTYLELNNTVRKIFELLLNGVKADDICITLLSKSAFSYLNYESLLYGIKLNYIHGYLLSEYKTGVLLTVFYDLYNSSFEFSKMRKFLSEPSFLFKDREFTSEVIRYALDNKILYLEKKYLKMFFYTSLYERISLLISYISVIATTSDKKTFQQSLYGFIEEFFIKDYFDNAVNSSELRAHQMIMEILDKINIEDTNVIGEIPILAILLNVLQQTKYTENTVKEGIKVYDFPTDCGIWSKYHFIVGLNEDDASIVLNDFSFSFNPKILEDNKKEITQNIINSYLWHKENLFLSASIKTYDSDVTLPHGFLYINDELGYADPYKYEKSLFNKNLCFNNTYAIPVQKERFYIAMSTVFQSINKDVVFYADYENLVTYSRLSDYLKCPLRFYIKHELKVERLSYDIVFLDTRDLGDILHNVLESYLKNKNTDLNSILYKSMFNSLKDKSDEVKLYYTGAYFFYKNKLQLFPKLLQKKIGLAFSDYSSETEFSFDQPFNDYNLKGRIDCLLKEDNSNNLIVLDIKTNIVPNDNLQLLFYSKALKTIFPDSNIAMGSYYSIKKASFSKGWKSTEDLSNMISEIDDAIEEYVKGLKCGVIKATPSEKSCSECDYSSICRKRFVIK